jgi:hypothetical protein
MKLFKDAENNIFAYEIDGSQDHLIGDKTPITQEEANTIIASKTPIFSQEQQAQATAKASALAKLTALGLTQDEVKALIG